MAILGGDLWWRRSRINETVFFLSTMSEDPATVASVEDYLSAMSDIPAVAMDQASAELTLTDIVDTLSSRAEDGEWDWIRYFCKSKGIQTIFAIFHDAGEEDLHHGLLIRGVLAFEAAQIALGHKVTLDIIARTPSIVQLFVLEFEAMPSKVISAALRTLSVIAMHSIDGFATVIATMHGERSSPESKTKGNVCGNSCWEAIVDILARPKTQTLLKRDALALLNVLIVAGPNISHRMMLHNLLKSAGFDKAFKQLRQWAESNSGSACGIAEKISIDTLGELDLAQLHADHKEHLRIQINIYFKSLQEDIQTLGRMCHYADLQVLWNRGNFVGQPNGTSTKNTASTLRQNMNRDAEGVVAKGPSDAEVRQLAGNAEGAVKLLAHINELKRENSALRRKMGELRLNESKIKADKSVNSEEVEQLRVEIQALKASSGIHTTSRLVSVGPRGATGPARGAPRLPPGARGLPRLPTGSRGVPRLPPGARGLPRLPTGGRGVPRLPAGGRGGAGRGGAGRGGAGRGGPGRGGPGRGGPGRGGPGRGGPGRGGPGRGGPRGAIGMGPPIPTKPNPKPPVPMKGIFWTTIHARTIDGTIWKDVDDSEVEIDTALLIDHFSAKKSKERASDLLGSSEKQARSSPRSVQIVDAKKQQNAGIVISRLKMNSDELRSAVISMNESILTQDRVAMLINIAPTPEETGALQSYDGNPSLLGKVDKVLLELSMITHLKEQLQCLNVKYTFANQAAELKRLINFCSLAVTQIRDSLKFKSLLRVILCVGNFMNGGSRRGGAFGIKLDVLKKIQTSKSQSGKFTLVHYIVQMLKTIDPSALKLQQDLSACKVAANYTLGQLQGDFAVLRQGMKIVQNEVAWAEKSAVAPNFSALMGPFATEIEDTVNSIETDLKTLKNDFESVVASYGENPAKTELDAFFKPIEQFCAVFELAVNRLEESNGLQPSVG